ncbi:MAG TPA: helix-turn-helix domain-containing protein, partial [Flavitalea sp.]|nr:helix-turn-helix domain-containing protein [Flavitalea sp.]
SHVPVILLTAVATEDARIRGLETGADDYLTKPFDTRELLTRVRNLIETRKQLRDRFSRELYLGPKKTIISSMDEKFLEKVMETIETFMGEPEFSMEKFGQEVGLSRMQLHRKLKALTGQSPGDFLRSMRLKKAKRLLEAKAGNVSEIGYEVGFNNLSYFSKTYREEFGISPSESVTV